MKRALICGVSGQDGAYLAQLLLDKGYEVFGSSRDAQNGAFTNLERLGIRDRVATLSMALDDLPGIKAILETIQPAEIYNLAGQTSVSRSFEQPVETMESIASATLNLLEAIRVLGSDTRYFNAGSSECFGEVRGDPATEETPFLPKSPYAVAKCAAHWEVANFRDAYGVFACSGILFNHESPLRSPNFVTQKIVQAAKRIAGGSTETLELGNTGVIRDWGWAPEYVDAMWRMLQQEKPDDYVIATGQSVSLEDFVQMAFERFGLDWKKHVTVNRSLFRPLDIVESRGNPAKAARVLGWTARSRVKEVIDQLVG